MEYNHDPRDHDLLVRLDTKLDLLTSAFLEIKLSVAAKADSSRLDKLESTRIEKLERDVEVTMKAKADAARLSAVESEIKSIQARLYFAAGGLAALQAFIHFFWK